MAMKTVRQRYWYGCGVCAALFWAGVGIGAEETAPRKNVLGDSRSNISSLKPVTTDFDTDVVAKYKRDVEARYAAQDAKLAEAKKLFQDGKFELAVRMAETIQKELKLEAEYVNSVVVRSRLNEVERGIAKMREMWGRERLGHARLAIAERRISDAISFISEATAISAVLTAEAQALLERCQGIQQDEKFQASTSIDQARMPDDEGARQRYVSFEEERKKIRALLAEAQVFYENKRYTEALSKVEKVYLLDPLNMAAITLAGQIYQQYYTYGYHRHRADYERMNAYATWLWAEPVFLEAPPLQAKTETTTKDRGVQETLEHLDRIICPRFEFSNADVRSVIDFLKRNKQWDNSKPATGVAIHYRATQEDEEKLGKVTLRLGYVPLGQLLRYISLMTGLKYRVEKDGVHIGTSIGNLENQTFDVNSQLEDYIVQNNTGTGDAGKGGTGGAGGKGSIDDAPSEGLLSKKDAAIGGEEIKALVNTKPKPTSEMFQRYFEARGVQFSPGTSMVYYPSSSQLDVVNTRANLNILDSLVRELSALDSPMILIEVKSIEISDKDAQELGFNWSLDQNLGSNMTDNGDSWGLNPGSNNGWMFGPGLNATRRPVPDGASYSNNMSMIPIRNSLNATSTGSSVSNAIVNNLNIFPMLFGTNHPFGSDIPLNISLTINALDQNSRTEVLSAPKVLTESGIAATAELTKNYVFPESWEPLEVETEANDTQTYYTITPPKPEFNDEGTALGIEFTVTPQILSDRNNTISLNLDIMMLSLAGRDEYPLQLTVKDLTANTTDVYNYNIWMPVFSERRIKTQVDIEDGETIIVGGSTINETNTRTDKLPFLGDLPLIGRFFQAQSENSDRRNMLVFVTARLVGADGIPIRRNNSNGIIDFNR